MTRGAGAGVDGAENQRPQMIDKPSTGVSFGQDARDYYAFRPQYPAALFDWLKSLAPSDALAWDCGTGSGQAAAALAGRFRRVLATDLDRRQLAMAPPAPNIDYRVAAAEDDPGLRGEADLVACGCSVHWFDLERFYANARRALRPDGVIAVWTYDWPWTGSAPVDAVLEKLKSDILGAFWEANSVYYFGRYENLPFPFADVSSPRFCAPVAGSASGLLDFLSTWSAVKKFRSRESVDPLGLICDELHAAWRSAPPASPVEIPLHMRVGRCDRA